MTDLVRARAGDDEVSVHWIPGDQASERAQVSWLRLSHHRRWGTSVFVPEGFDPPTELVVVAGGDELRLEPLGPEHNERDHAAWTSSMDHILASPGFAGKDWPRPKTLEENAEDLAGHADDFAARRGFTYSVLGADDDVVGCVYIYPDEPAAPGRAHVSSWVRADVAHLDGVLRRKVWEWLRRQWPFEELTYAGVPGEGSQER